MTGSVSGKVLAITAGGLLAASPLLAACNPRATEPAGYRDWAATDGAAGRINLDAVQMAFQDAASASDFETRVNEIYEGDGLILVRVAQEADRMVLEGWEDLDGNSEINDVVDDLMFSIVRQDDQHELVGHHANSYHRSSFGAGDFLFFYLLAGGLRGNNYYYQTPPGRGPVLRQQRDAYRGSSRHRTQQQANRRYTSRQQTFHGSRYHDAGRNLGTSRSSYQTAQKTTGSFRNSASFSGGRSGSISSGGGSRSSIFSGGGGGFSGGGGAAALRVDRALARLVRSG